MTICDHIEPLIIISVAAGGVIHRARCIDVIIDDDLFQMHQAVVRVHPYRDARRVQNAQRSLLFRVGDLATIRQHPDIDPTFFASASALTAGGKVMA